ncbi:Tetracycline resistance protein, class C [Planctomycetes bacterium Pan216]|uniref:Tetracycline resistance protein, class C n=1 Tax=Kolteria novifilia TaxID=2527975 RepID=A0A518B1D4_9BACT|nr:Tetracycline resistance protein, class C [Planctomycetes bacterium Pan216]
MLTLFICTIVFLSTLGNALTSPVLAPFFLHPDIVPTFLPGASPASKAFLLGLVMSLGRFAEFLGSPVVGQLSDRYGRRALTVVTLIANAGGQGVTAFGVGQRSLGWILGGQFVVGFFSVLLVLVMAEFAGRWRGPDRTQRFGLVYLSMSLAYVVGPYVGGMLADGVWTGAQDYALPYIVAAIVNLLVAPLVVCLFPSHSATSPPRPFRLLEHLTEMRTVFTMAGVGWLLVINFVLYLGIDFVFQFNPVYFVQKWHFSSGKTGELMAITSVAMVLTQAVAVRPLADRFSNARLTRASAFGLSLMLVWLVVPEGAEVLFVILPAIGFTMALATTNMSALISHAVSDEVQGRVLGVFHSVRVLGSALLCFVGGALASLSPQLPILVGATAAALAAILLGVYVPGGRRGAADHETDESRLGTG